MSEVNRYSTSAGGTVQNTAGYFPEGQAPSTVNDAARTVMADVRRYVQTQVPELTATFSAQAYSLTYDRDLSSGELAGIYTYIADAANTGSATLNINSIGAKALKQSGAHLRPYAIAAKDVCVAAYNKSGDFFDLLSPNKHPSALCAFHARPSANQASVAYQTNTKVLYATETYDAGGDFASSAFVAPTTSIYRLTASVQSLTNLMDAEKLVAYFSIGGDTNPLSGSRENLGSDDAIVINLSWEGRLSAGDSVAVYVWHNYDHGTPGGSPITLDANGDFSNMFFSGSRVF